MSNGINRQQVGTEQKINELVQQSRILEAYMNDIITREATLTRLIEEGRLASTSIQSIVDEEDVESLTPVGIGVYIKTVVPPIKKLLVNVGAGVTIEKTREDGINYVEARLKDFEVALRQLLTQKQQIALRMEQIQEQINQMLQQVSRASSTSQPNSLRQTHDAGNSSSSSRRQPTHSH